MMYVWIYCTEYSWHIQLRIIGAVYCRQNDFFLGSQWRMFSNLWAIKLTEIASSQHPIRCRWTIVQSFDDIGSITENPAFVFTHCRTSRPIPCPSMNRFLHINHRRTVFIMQSPIVNLGRNSSIVVGFKKGWCCPVGRKFPHVLAWWRLNRIPWWYVRISRAMWVHFIRIHPVAFPVAFGYDASWVLLSGLWVHNNICLCSCMQWSSYCCRRVRRFEYIVASPRGMWRTQGQSSSNSQCTIPIWQRTSMAWLAIACLCGILPRSCGIQRSLTRVQTRPSNEERQAQLKARLWSVVSTKFGGHKSDANR
jgi:hypothetical protein